MRGYLALAVAVAACGGSPKPTEHRADLTKFLPATLEAAHAKEGDARVVHVRVWADAAIRALPHWKEDLGDQLDYASQLLTPLLGIKLTVDAVKDWDRQGQPSVRDALRELAALDPGDDVTWVIGFMAPSDVASKAMSQLGDGLPLGHHILVRGWAEKPETTKMAGLLPDLKEAERAEVIGAHRRHKQTVVVLHMLAATLGAIAEADPAWIQSATYAPRQATFSDRNRELMTIAIDDRLAGGNDRTTGKKLLDAIEKAEWGGWIASDHDAVVAALRNVVEEGKAVKTAVGIPAAAAEQFARIDELRKTDPKSALVELDNLLAAYPGNANIHLLHCEILIALRPKGAALDKQTRAACSHVSELAPGDPTVHLVVAEALEAEPDARVRNGFALDVRAELAQAEMKIANLESGAGDAWRRVIAVYAAMGALTWTEDALAAAKVTGDPIATEIRTKRVRYGVQRGAKYVTPEGEAALVQTVKDTLELLIYAGKFGPAATALAAADKKWPGAPGIAAARCDLALRQDQTGDARAQCSRALAIDPEESWALYLTGALDLRDESGTRAGIAQLKKAIAVDPELAQAWRTLAKALERAHDKAALDQLAKDYQTKFGKPLP